MSGSPEAAGIRIVWPLGGRQTTNKLTEPSLITLPTVAFLQEVRKPHSWKHFEWSKQFKVTFLLFWEPINNNCFLLAKIPKSGHELTTRRIHWQTRDSVILLGKSRLANTDLRIFYHRKINMSIVALKALSVTHFVQTFLMLKGQKAS